MRNLLLTGALLAATAAFAQVDATEVGPGIEKKTKQAGEKLGMATERSGTFDAAKAFEIQGWAKDSARGEITLTREGLPEAVLDVRDETKVMLDGKRIEAKDLPEGAFVRAKFQLEGEETVAVELHASSKKKSGEAKKEMGAPEQSKERK